MSIIFFFRRLRLHKPWLGLMLSGRAGLTAISQSGLATITNDPLGERCCELNFRNFKNFLGCASKLPARGLLLSRRLFDRNF
jgi:hypothetical protein